MKNTRVNVKMLCLTALFTALTAVATALVTIPMPTGGYVNFGDSIIFIAAVCLGPLPAALAGGIGSMIIDLMLAPIYAPFTLVIKALEGLIVGLILRSLRNATRSKSWIDMAVGLVSMVISGAVMVILYYFTDVLLYGSFAAAVATFIPNALQATISVAIGFTLAYLCQLRRISRKLVGDSPRFLDSDKHTKSSSSPPNSADSLTSYNDIAADSDSITNIDIVSSGKLHGKDTIDKDNT